MAGMRPGQRLYAGQRFDVGGVQLYFDASDGVLKVLAPGSVELWRLEPGSASPSHAEFQADGNLVSYGAEGAYASTGTFARQPVMDVSRRGLVISGYDEVQRWDFPVPPEPPAPEPGTLPDFLASRKITAQLRCDGESFFSGLDVALPVGCHAGDLLGQWAVLPGKRDEIVRALDQMYTAGYAFLRCWSNIPPNPWWSDKPAPAWGIFETPGFDALYDSFVAELRERGLKLHLVPGGLDRYDRDQRMQFYRWTQERVSASPSDYCLVEGVNESDATGAGHLRDEIEQLFIKPIVDRTGVLGALSATGGTEDRVKLRAWTPAWMRFCYYHSYRAADRIADIIRHHFSFVREDVVRRLAWSGEPTGPWFPRVTDGFRTMSAEGVGMLHVQTALCRTIPCFMSSPGVIFEQPFESVPGFTTTPTAVARLPKDVHRFALTHGGADNAMVRATEANGALVRCDQAFNFDGRFAATAYSERPGAVSLPTSLSFEGEWFSGLGQPIAEQRGGAFRAPETYPGSYFVGRRL